MIVTGECSRRSGRGRDDRAWPLLAEDRVMAVTGLADEARMAIAEHVVRRRVQAAKRLGVTPKRCGKHAGSTHAVTETGASGWPRYTYRQSGGRLSLEQICTLGHAS
jgi:hypothetical protein